ncbi:MAG: hypothetical protein ACERLG_03440 [Sedimentibacter sp.]
MKHIGKFKVFTITFLIFAIAFSYNNNAYADIGPKDKLTVHVVNPPDELYYLDLLAQDTNTYNNFYNEGEREAFNQNMVKLLYSYENEGWRPALVEGTGGPMWGDLVGKYSGNDMIHTFEYVGVPDKYRIIIVTESGKVSVTDAYTRKSLQSSITYDYSNGRVTVPPVLLSYILQFLTTCIPTLIIEGIILVLFGFKIKENWKVFLIVNLVTQIGLTLTLGASLIHNGPVTVYFMQFPAEIGIIIIETFLYGKLLKGKSVRQRHIYGITANLLSWAVGFFLLSYQYQLLNLLS